MADPTWFALSQEYHSLSPDKRGPWIAQEITKYLGEISGILDSNVLVYFSAFMQKPCASGIEIAVDDINGLMNSLYDLDDKKPLAVIMHTSGGDISAAEHITEYIHCTFGTVKVIVPTMAMSAGTMFALSCDKIIISKAGQLGPIDPQLFVSKEDPRCSSRDIIRRYENIKHEILQAPFLGKPLSSLLESYGSFLQNAIQNEAHAKNMVCKWLKDKDNSISDDAVEEIFSSFYHKTDVHSQCIGYRQMKELPWNKVELLEDQKNLQSPVMGVYHLSTLCAENTKMIKMIVSNNNQFWIRNEDSTGEIEPPCTKIPQTR